MILRGKITCLCEAMRAGKLAFELPHSKILNKDLRCESDLIKSPLCVPFSQEHSRVEVGRIEEVETKIMTHRTGLLKNIWLHTTVQNANVLLRTVHYFF